MPVRIGLVHLDIGVDVVAYVHPGCANAPARVRLRAHLDKAGQAAMVAHPPGDRFDMSQSKVLSDMISDPRGRNILVTDGKTATGQAMVKALVEAGAEPGMGGRRRALEERSKDWTLSRPCPTSPSFRWI